MLDRLLGPKFSNKCKQSVKCIKCRVETIRKKKHAMERCLKKDIADLVSAGHDANAFGRMDALIFEINQTSCYDIIEQYCCCILEHLPTMQKERECPKETLEAVATLIFAAARFPDLPELADLRRRFTERYRTTMESYTNRDFVEKLQKKSFPRDEKLQLMKDIAKEFSIDWDVKSFEYKTSNPLSPTTDHPMRHCPSSSKNHIDSHVPEERKDVTDRRNGVNGRKAVLGKTDGRREVTSRRNEVVNGRKPVLQKAEGTTCLASDVQELQIEFEKLKTVNNNEDQKIKQMEEDEHSKSAVKKHRVQTEEHRNLPASPKNINAHLNDSTEKIKKVAADESKNVEPYHFSKRPPYVKGICNQNGNARKRSEVHEESGLVGTERRGATRNDKVIHMSPPDTKFTEDFNGTNSYHDGFVHSTAEKVVKEMEHNGQQRQLKGAVNPESKRAYNLKPPYVKPKVKSLLETGYVKPTNFEMHSGSDNADDHMIAAFSVRKKHLVQGTVAHASSTGEDGNLPWKISTKHAGVVMKNNVMHMDLNDQQSFSLQSQQIEDDATDGVLYHARGMHQTYIDQTTLERRSTNASYDGGCDKEVGKKTDKLLQHYSKKGDSDEPGKARTGTREPPTQSIFDSSIISKRNYLG